MRKILLVICVLWQINLLGQVIFEVNQPASLANVYPCIEPNTEWNSPYLNTVGNWFSDTLVLIENLDGCSTLSGNYEGKFVLVNRNNCTLTTKLLNIQQTGALGVVIQDTVDGRPLPFVSESLSNQINLPFTIISRGIGDSLKEKLQQNQTCIVSFGNKQGVFQKDLGIYQERTFHPKYETNFLLGIDTNEMKFNTWVFNKGVDTIFNSTVTLNHYFQSDNNSFQSNTFNINPNDSVLIEFPFHARYDSLIYSFSAGDDDTLDNKIKLTMSNNNVYSESSYTETQDYNLENYVDYYLESKKDSLFDGICFNLNNYFDAFDPIFCIGIELEVSSPIDSLVALNYLLFIEDTVQNKFILNRNQSQIAQFTDLYADPWDLFPTGTLPLVINFQYCFQFLDSNAKIGYNSDSYKDEYFIQNEIPYFLMNGYDSLNGPVKSNYQPDKRLNPLFKVSAPWTEGCGIGLNESFNSQIKIYPNPSSNFIKINNLNFQNTIFEIELVDILGQQINTFDKKIDVIDISNLDSGIYYIVFKTDQGFIRKSFVKE